MVLEKTLNLLRIFNWKSGILFYVEDEVWKFFELDPLLFGQMMSILMMYEFLSWNFDAINLP